MNFFHHKTFIFMEGQVYQPKPKIMGIDTLRDRVISRIQQADESFLRILDAMTEAYENEHQEAEFTDTEVAAMRLADESLKPMSREELHAELKEGLAQVERGEFVTIEDLKKEMEQW
jgi:hypothetical protein